MILKSKERVAQLEETISTFDYRDVDPSNEKLALSKASLMELKSLF